MAPTSSAVRDGREERSKSPAGEASSGETDERPEDRSGERPDGRPTPAKSSHVITEFIEVGVPLNETFEHFTKYEKWSEMFKKESAEPSDDGAVTVTAKIGPSRRQWRTEWHRNDDGRRVDWHATGGLQAHGTTTFHRLDDRLTRVMAEIDYHPSGAFEMVGNFFRMPRRRVRRDLRLFKHYIELRVDQDSTDQDSTQEGDDG